MFDSHGADMLPDAREFERVYAECVGEVMRFWSPPMQESLATHCRGWACGAYDFHAYLRCSARRYRRAFQCIAQRAGCRKICDVGGFLGVFPLALRRLGFDVAMTEALGYYAGSFTPLFDFIGAQGVNVIDYDPFGDTGPSAGGFDALSVMAVIEHYPHSLARFLGNVKAMGHSDSMIFVEVPNIAYWPKRMALLRGATPLVHIRDIYLSRVPFIGHHHEFTIGELRELAGLAGLKVDREFFYSYSQESHVLRRLATHPIETIAAALFPATRECIAISATMVGEHDS